MSSINLLHASDLHISIDACLRSPIDRWSDVEKLWDFFFCIHFPPSFQGIKNTNRLLGEADVLKAAHDEDVDGILAGHTHKQLTYTNPASNCPVYCCGTTTQFEPRSMPGGPDEHNLLKGNFFQILSISSDYGVPRITVQHFRLFGVRDWSGQILLEWKKIP